MFEPAALAGTFTFPMAEDDMEILSEHGHNAGDEDIDIDIDLTAGHLDEDYVLEDATSTVDFGNDFQESAIGQDDLMIDDDNHSYQMDDADLLQDEGAQAMEPESMSFAISAAPIISEDYTNTSHIIPEDMHEQAVVENEQLDVSEDVILQTDPHPDEDHQESVQLQASHIIQAQGPVLEEDEQFIQAPEDSANVVSKSASVSPAPDEDNVTAPPNDQAVKASPPSVDQSAAILSHTPEHTEGNLENQASAVNDAGAVTVISPDQEELSSPAPEIFVTYRSVRYTLFSVSELEDPDSYFLSDPSIMGKPLPDFFQAIREVIHEDLSDEDELRISVGGLGLEAQEASPSIEDVTLSQLLSLHEQLLCNVDEDPPGPLSLTLDVKPNFHRRLSKLIAGAADGNGLRDIFPWEFIESVLDSGEDDEHQHNLESGVQGEEVESTNEPQNSEDQLVLDSNVIGPENPSTSDPDNVQKTRSSTTSTSGSKALIEASAPTRIGSEAPKSKKILDSSVDEDGDLIDYSEDEFENEEEQKQESGSKTANDRKDNEYEQINQNLRKRSLSRDGPEISEELKEAQEVPAVEGNSLDQWHQTPQSLGDSTGEKQSQSEEYGTGNEDQAEESLEQWQHSPHASGDLAANEEKEQEQVEENGVGYDDYTEDNLDQSWNAEYEDSSTADAGVEGDHNYSAALGQEEFADNNINYEYGVEEEEYTDQDGQEESFGDGVVDEESNELNVALETGDQAQSPNRKVASEKNGDADLSGHLDNSASGSTFVDTAESSVTLSADEIQYEDDLDEEVFDESTRADNTRLWTEDAKPDLIIEQKDEIDYEDDEEEEKSELVSIPLVQPLQAVKDLSPANGKRSRAEVGFDDVSNVEGNNAKRPRS